MTTIPLASILAFGSEALAAAIGTALMVLIIWQAPRHRDNQLMALYMFSILIWGVSNSAARLLTIFEMDNSLFFYISALCIPLNGFILFGLVTHYANLWEKWVVKAALVFGLILLAITTPAAFEGLFLRYVDNGAKDLLGYEIYPSGYLVFAIFYLYYIANLVILWQHRHQRAGSLWIGTVLTCVGVLCSVIPVVQDYPLDITCVAVGSLFFARSILNEKLFNPLAELNTELSEANQRLTNLAEELQESQANLSALIESTPDMVWSVDPDYHLLTINNAFSQMFKVVYGHELHNGMCVIDFVSDEHHSFWKDLYDRALKGESFTVEQGYTTHGLDLIVDVSLTPIRAANGIIAGVSVFGRDVTERHNAENLLRQQKEYLSALNETTVGLIRRLELNDLLHTIINRAAALVGTNNGYIYLLEPGKDEMTLQVGIGAQAGHVGISLQPGEGMAGKVWLSGESLVVDDYNTWSGKIEALDEIAIHAVVCIPLKVDRHVIGAIGLAYLEEGRVFGPADVELLSRFAELASVAIDNARLYDTLQKELEERKRAEAAAEAANRAKSTFLANMSHELRTPLNAIIGYSEMLEEDLQNDSLDAYIPDLEKVQLAGRHLLGLINDILDLSKIEAGRMNLDLHHFDLNGLVQNAVATVQPLINKNDNELVIETPPIQDKMHSDPTKVQQCLVNLLSNAAKFTSQGTIRLEVGISDWVARGIHSTSVNQFAENIASVHNCGTVVVFRVIDSGIGISDEQLDKLFQPFTQIDPSATRKYGGTGLGLAITKRYCQMMNGDVSVESEIGKGSTFLLWLPLNNPPENVII